MPAARTKIEWLMEELCTHLGFSLPPAEQRRLAALGLSDLDAFTDAVFTAKGLDPEADPPLRARVRALVETYASA